MDLLDVIINNLSPHERWILRQATMPDKITYTPQVDLFERPTQDEINKFLNKPLVPPKEVDLSTLSEKPSNTASWLLALQAAGQLANVGNEAILDSLDDSPNVNDAQNLVYKNSWGEVLNNSKRRSDINDMIMSERRDFSDVNNIYNLQNVWDPNMQQSSLRKMNGWETFGTIGTSALSDAASGAATGFAAGTAIPGIGQGIGAGVGAAAGFLSGLGRSAIGAIQGNNTVDYANKLIDQTNSYNLNNYFDTAKSIRKNMYRNIAAEGGPMESLNGLTFFNTGGTHGSNPLGGIPQGVDSEGVPNLVEQGEVKYNDYIFSSRNKISERLLNKYNLPKNLAGKTFAEVATKLQEDSQERPYDPVSVNGLEDSMGKLMAAQEEVRSKKAVRKVNAFEEFNNTFAEGGDTKDPDIPPELAIIQQRAQRAAAAKRRYEQQYGGQRAKQLGNMLARMFSLQNLPDPVYLDSYGSVPYKTTTVELSSNSVTNTNSNKVSSTQQKEKTSPVTKTYIVTRGNRKLRVKATSPEEAKKQARRYWTTNYATSNSTPSEYTSTRTSVKVSEKVRVPVGSRTGSSTVSRKKNTAPAPQLITPEENPTATPTQNTPVNPVSNNPQEVEPRNNNLNAQTPTASKYRRNPLATAAMMAPAIGNMGQALTDALGLTNRPDYTVEQGLRRNASQLNPIAPKLNGDYMEYTPYDVNIMNNQLLAQEYSAQRAARENTNRATQAAQLLALNNSFGNMGFLANLQAQQANEAKKNATLQWNHGINRENSATIAAYDELNQGIKQQRLNMLNQAIQARDASDTARAQVTSANRAAALTDLGSLGRYINDTNLTQALINSGVFGKLNTDMSDAYGNLQLFNLFRQ